MTINSIGGEALVTGALTVEQNGRFGHVGFRNAGADGAGPVVYRIIPSILGPRHPAGSVTSTAGAPLGEVRIEVVEVHRSSTTDPDGRYRIAQLPAGRYSVTFARIGFAPVVRVVSMAEEDLTLDLTMKESAIELAPIQVTASPLATTALTSPQPLSVVAGEDLHTALRPSLGETLEGQPGIRNLSTGSGIGKPVIRGLTSNRVLVLADGQRI